MERFESWLTEKLLSVNPDTDTDVFVSYIAGILEEESPEAEKKESILDLLGQVVVINFFLVYKYWLFKNRIHLPLKNDCSGLLVYCIHRLHKMSQTMWSIKSR